jgi:hypothetical protein
MRTFALPLTILGTILVPLLHAGPAQALNNKSWVSSTGSGSTCTRALPCANFQVAHDQTNAGGEIGVVDSGEYGLLVINRAISIVAEGVDATIVSSGAGSAAITFSGSMIPTDVVNLQGLIIDGLGTGGFGISWPFGPALVVKNCVIRNFKASGGAGISVLINAAGRLTVTDTLLVNNGTGLTGGGISIKPQSGVSVQALLQRVTAVNNSFGIIADGTAGGSVRGAVRDSAVSGNVHNGITVSSSGAGSAVLSVENTTVSGNDFGLVAGGASSGMLVSQSSIVLNNTGLFTTGGGVLLSYKNNSVNGNTTADGAFTGIIGQQ